MRRKAIFSDTAHRKTPLVKCPTAFRNQLRNDEIIVRLCLASGNLNYLCRRRTQQQSDLVCFFHCSFTTHRRPWFLQTHSFSSGILFL